MVTFLKLLLKQGLMGPPTPSYSVQKHINSPHLSTQSVPDSQTALPQARSIWRSCSATPFHGRNTGFASGRVGEQFRMCWFHSLVCPNRNNRRTTANCHLYRSSPSVCRFGRSRSSGFAGNFLRLRWCGFDRRNRVRTAHTLRQDWRFCAGYGLLVITS